MYSRNGMLSRQPRSFFLSTYQIQPHAKRTAPELRAPTAVSIWQHYRNHPFALLIAKRGAYCPKFPGLSCKTDKATLQMNEGNAMATPPAYGQSDAREGGTAGEPHPTACDDLATVMRMGASKRKTKSALPSRGFQHLSWHAAPERCPHR